jgi:hypothetical protein
MNRNLHKARIISAGVYWIETRNAGEAVGLVHVRAGVSPHWLIVHPRLPVNERRETFNAARAFAIAFAKQLDGVAP